MKYLISLSVASLVALTGFSQAKAFLPGEWDMFGLNLEGFTDFLKPNADLGDLLDQSIEELGSLSETFDFFSEVTGDFSSDPYVYRQQLMSKGSDVLSELLPDELAPSSQDVPITERLDAANALDRDLSRAHSSTVIGEVGQQRSAEKLEETNATLEAINELSEEALAAPSTQEAIKAIAQQNASAAVLSAQIRAEILEQRADQQFTNLTSADVSETLDHMRRKELQEQRALVRMLQQHAEATVLY